MAPVSNDNEHREPNLRTLVNDMRVEMATVKAQLTQFKWLFAVMSVANVSLTIIVNVQVA